MHVAQARGHLLLITSGTMVYAFDLAEKSEKKKLWEYNLLGKGTVVPPGDARAGSRWQRSAWSMPTVTSCVSALWVFLKRRTSAYRLRDGLVALIR